MVWVARVSGRARIAKVRTPAVRAVELHGTRWAVAATTRHVARLRIRMGVAACAL
jgi:hypothetical protein